MGMDLSYLEALMGGAGETGGGTGGVWVVSPDGALNDGILRLVGKARVIADALGGYVYLLLGNTVDAASQPAIQAGADRILLAAGLPGVPELAEFFRGRDPQAILFPRTYQGRVLGPGLAQALGGGLAGYAADLAVEAGSGRVIAHQPVLGDAARQWVTILAGPAVVVVDTQALPAAFSEPWRTGEVEQVDTGWPAPVEYPAADLPHVPVTLHNAPVVVGAGRALGAAGVALARQLAERLGGVLGGDRGALDAGWIGPEELLDITGQSVTARLYLALGISGDTEHLIALRDAGSILAVQPDRSAPIALLADWNVFAEPGAFAQDLLDRLSA